MLRSEPAEGDGGTRLSGLAPGRGWFAAPPSVPLMRVFMTTTNLEPFAESARAVLRGKSALAAALTAALLLMAVPAAAQTPVSSADDVCAPADNPCMIEDHIVLQAGAVLDFGVRGVVVTGNGLLDWDSNRASLLAGEVTVGGNGIDLAGGPDGGTATIEARRGCSDAPAQPCKETSECALGTCSLGTGNFTLTSPVLGVGRDIEADFTVDAAGDVRLQAKIDLHGKKRFSVGGYVTIYSAQGSVFVEDNIDLYSGAIEIGGEVILDAELDVRTDAEIRADGGDSGGGVVTVSAGRDILINRTIRADARDGAGDGDAIELSAGRDVIVTGLAVGNQTVLHVSGSGADGWGGYGGFVGVDAERDVRFGEHTRIEGTGAGPDGTGAEVDVFAGGELTFDGKIDVHGKGLEGEGGVISFDSVGDAVFGAGFSADLTGGEFDGGEFDLVGDADLVFDGDVVLLASGDGSGGPVDFEVAGRAVIDGTFSTNGFVVSLDFSACELEFGPNALLNNRALLGSNDLSVGRSLHLKAGSRVKADAGPGSNDFSYGDPRNPPLLEGTVAPEATIIYDQQQVICPVCGNGVVNQGETCDDGNLDDDDGCSADCQLEGCIDDTPGYPGVALCDDGSLCTNDVCNLDTESCDNEFLCDDGIDCTTDECVADVCVNTADTEFCDNGLYCDGPESCVLDVGCQVGAAPDCSDEFVCTDDVCDEAADTCTNDFIPGCTTTTTTTSTTTTTTTTTTTMTTTTTLPPVLCGDANGDGEVKVTDALAILRAAVMGGDCDPRACDVNNTGSVNTTDALIVLQASVGARDDLVCPSALPTTTSTLPIATGSSSTSTSSSTTSSTMAVATTTTTTTTTL